MWKEPEDFDHVVTVSTLGKRIAAAKTAPYRVSVLIPRTGIVIVVGDSGIGKSAFLYQLGVCVATGKPFLGHPTRKGRVFLYDGENAPVQSYNLIQQLQQHLEIEEVPRDFLLYNRNDPHPKFGQSGYKLQDYVERYRPSVVIIDPLASLYPEAEDGSVKANSSLDELRGFSAKYDCVFVVAHHTRKENPDKPSLALETADPLMKWLDQTRGAKALINGTDMRLALAPPMTRSDEAALVLRGLQRIEGEMPIHWIAREFDENGDPLGYKRLPSVNPLAKAEDQEAFTKLPEEFTTADVKGVLGKGSNVTNIFLKACISGGIAERVDRGQFRKVTQEPEEAGGSELVN